PSSFIKEQQDDDSLYLQRGRNSSNRDIGITDPTASQIVQTLKNTPGLFTLSWPHNYAQFFSTSLFFWDRQRVFYVTSPQVVLRPVMDMPSISPGVINGVTQTYLPAPSAAIQVFNPPPAPPPVILSRVNRPNAALARGDIEKTPIVQL